MQSWAFRSVAFSLATACEMTLFQRTFSGNFCSEVPSSLHISPSLHRSLSTKGADTWHLVPEETVGSEDFNYHVKHVL